MRQRRPRARRRTTTDRCASSEDARAAATAARIVEYRARFVDGPVLRIPLRGSSFSFDPNGVTPFPGVGSVYEGFARPAGSASSRRRTAR